MLTESPVILIKGAGDLATGVAWRLRRCGFMVVMTEISEPTTVRRNAAFSEAVYEGMFAVEGITAQLLEIPAQIYASINYKLIPIVVDPKADIIKELKPYIIIASLLFFPLAVSCIKDDGPETKEAANAKTIVFTLSSSSPATAQTRGVTRAIDDPTDNEKAINRLDVFFYDAALD